MEQDRICTNYYLHKKRSLLRKLEVLAMSFTSASISGRPIWTSRILISKLKADSGKTSQETWKNKSPLQKAEFSQRSDHLRAGNLLGWSATSSGLVAAMNLRDLSKVQKARALKSRMQSGTKYYQQSLTDLLTTCWFVWTGCKLKNRKCWDMFLHVYTQETTFGDKKYDYCRLQFLAQRYLEQKIRDFQFKSEKSRWGQTCNRSSEQRKGERRMQRKCQKLFWERRLHTLDHRRPMFTWRLVCHHDPSKRGKGKGRPRSPSPAGSPHRKSKGDGKCSDNGSAKWSTPKLTARTSLHKLQEWNLSKGKSFLITGMSLNVLNVKLQPDASTGTNVLTVARLWLLVTETIQQLLQSTSVQLINARCNHEKSCRITRRNSEWDSIISRPRMFWKGKTWDKHLESSRQCPNIS